MAILGYRARMRARHRAAAVRARVLRPPAALWLLTSPRSSTAWHMSGPQAALWAVGAEVGIDVGSIIDGVGVVAP